jgi:hypothetical protein
MPEVFCADSVSPAPNIVATTNIAARDSEFRVLAGNLMIISFLVPNDSAVRLRRDVARLTAQ